MSTTPVHQNQREVELGNQELGTYSPIKQPVSEGIANSKSTIQPAGKKECCDYVVPREKAPGCWQKLTPCQRKLICCGGVTAVGGSVTLALWCEGVLSGGASIGAGLGAAAACCLIPLSIVGILVCIKKWKDRND